MNSNILPIAFTAGSGAAGALTSLAIGSSIVAGGLLAAVPLAIGTLAEKAH